MIKTDEDRKGSFINVIFWAGLWVALLHVVLFQTGCTIKIDNPFYAPSTLDVNKNTSTGAANYLKQEAKAMTPGKAD